MLNLKGESVVIFGGSGFIGLHLTRRLIAEGACVTVADKISLQNFSAYPVRKFIFKRIDITKGGGLEKLLRNKKYVFNLAAAVPFSSGSGNSLKNSIDVNIKGAANDYPPLQINGGEVKPISYRMPVPSAQVKSAILFAGLYADGATIVEEAFKSRDHTERMLKYFGAEIKVDGLKVSVSGNRELSAKSFEIPGDMCIF